MRFRLLIYILAAILLLVPAVGAQDSDPLIALAGADMMDPLAHISFPPPVYVVRDSVDIRGTANLPGLRTLYIEFRELSLGMMDDAEAAEPQWFPATLPRIAAVVDDVLGTWNTASLPDGLYELQLLINTGDGAVTAARVSPIRIENSPPEFLMDTMPEDSSEAMPEDDDMPEESTEAMAEEPVDDMEEGMADDMDDMEEEPVDDSPQYDGPYIVVTVPGANVRSGDSTAYPLVGVLLEGNTAPIMGVSSWNTGWWYIELSSGRRGFIAPFIVDAMGDTSAVLAIQPPPLPPTPIPTAIPQPTAPPAPATGPNLVVDGSPVVSPHPATCNQPYSISVRIKNIGNARSGGGLVEIVDSRHDGVGREVTYTPFRELDPGQSAVSQATITAKVYHGELHHINFHVDYDNRVAEMNENDNRSAAAPYILQKGDC